MKAKRIMEAHGIADNRRLRGLGDRQRRPARRVQLNRGRRPAMPDPPASGPAQPPVGTGRLIAVISGPSGVGKSTIVALVAQRHPVIFSVSPPPGHLDPVSAMGSITCSSRPTSSPRCATAASYSNGPSTTAVSTAPEIARGQALSRGESVLLDIECRGRSRSSSFTPLRSPSSWHRRRSTTCADGWREEVTLRPMTWPADRDSTLAAADGGPGFRPFGGQRPGGAGGRRDPAYTDAPDQPRDDRTCHRTGPGARRRPLRTRRGHRSPGPSNQRLLQPTREGLGTYVPPQVHSLSRKPETLALEEIVAGKLSVEQRDDE